MDAMLGSLIVDSLLALAAGVVLAHALGTWVLYRNTRIRVHSTLRPLQLADVLSELRGTAPRELDTLVDLGFVPSAAVGIAQRRGGIRSLVLVSPDRGATACIAWNATGERPGPRVVTFASRFEGGGMVEVTSGVAADALPEPPDHIIVRLPGCAVGELHRRFVQVRAAAADGRREATTPAAERIPALLAAEIDAAYAGLAAGGVLRRAPTVGWWMPTPLGALRMAWRVGWPGRWLAQRRIRARNERLIAAGLRG